MPTQAQIQPFQMPNTAAKMMQILQYRNALEAQQAENALAQRKLAAEQAKAANEKKKEAAEFTLNLLSGVKSNEDLSLVKGILKSRYPDGAANIDKSIPDEYNPEQIRLIRNGLMDATQRFQAEKFEWEKTDEVTSISPGSTVMQGGKPVGQAPQTKQYEVAENEKGEQIYVEVGGLIPEGFKVKSKSGVSVYTGDMGKSTQSQLEQDIIEAEKNIMSFGDTYKMFKPEYLEYVGKGKKEIASKMDKAGVSSEKQKEYLNEYQKWFRQAKADFIAYRKWATGVAGGEKELAEIATSFPDPVKNSPEEYKANIESIGETTRKVLELNRDFLRSGMEFSPGGNKGGNRVLKFDKNGKRVE